MSLQLLVLFGTFAGGLALGLPVFLAMGLAAAAYGIVFAPMLPDIVFVQTLMSGLDNTAFTAIPYFFLAGTVMNAGGMSARLLRLARALLARFRGGLAHANIGASVVFAGVSGSAVADAAAVGSVMIPAMRREGYPGAYAAAVTAASATIGLVIPPSIPMVVFGLFTGADIADLFLAGVVPGLLVGLFLLVTSAWLAARRGYAPGLWQGWGEVGAALAGSVLALLMPVLVVVGLVGGFATAAEIGAVAAVYAVLVSVVIYREASLRQLGAAVVEAAVGSARVLVIIALSGAFVWILASLGVAHEAAAAVEALGLSGTALLLLLALVLLLAGTVLEPITLLVVVVPVLLPTVIAGEIDIVQFGVVAVLACAIGLVTPPVGILLYITGAQAEAPALAVIREAAPYIAALVATLVLLCLVPSLSLALPQLLR